MDERRQTIIENRNMLLSLLGTVYPGSRTGASLFRSMLGPFPEYDRRCCVKDLYYLAEKGYVARRKKGSRADGDEAWDEASWALTASGNEVANRLVDDPALEV